MIRRKVTTIAALDVVGYSKLMAENELATLKRLRALKTETLFPTFDKWRGRVFKEMGDGMLVDFASVVDAIECAHAIQQSLKADAQGNSQKPLTLRIGIHFGEIIVENDDLFGDTVNIAARIESIADPGGVWLSDQARQIAGSRLELEFESMGAYQLKNISRPVDLYRIVSGSKLSDNVRPSVVSPKKKQIINQPLAMLGIVAACGLVLATAFFGIQMFQPSGTQLDKQKLLAEELRNGQEFQDCPQCPKMTAIAGGNLLMGAPPEGIKAGTFGANQGPQRNVSIKPFAIGKFEVTRKEFAKFLSNSDYKPPVKCRTWEKGATAVRKTRSYKKPGYIQKADHPVVCVSWHDANAYVDWMSKKTGRSYRLPSEAEWEFAARAGSDERFFFGSDVNKICRFDNIGDATARSKWSQWETANCSDGHIFTAPVGSFRANRFGLFDVYGNAREWVQDCWHNTFHNAPLNSKAWLKDSCKLRTVRGGSWDSKPSLLSSSWRAGLPAEREDFLYGFRVARDIGK